MTNREKITNYIKSHKFTVKINPVKDIRLTPNEVLMKFDLDELDNNDWDNKECENICSDIVLDNFYTYLINAISVQDVVSSKATE